MDHGARRSDPYMCLFKRAQPQKWPDRCRLDGQRHGERSLAPLRKLGPLREGNKARRLSSPSHSSSVCVQAREPNMGHGHMSPRERHRTGAIHGHVVLGRKQANFETRC